VTDQNTSEHKSTADLVQLTSEQIIAIADSLPVLVSFVDVAGCFQYNNKTYDDWFGRPRSTSIGRSMQEIFGPSGYAILEEEVRKAIEGESVDFEGEITFHDDTTRAVAGSFVPQKDANGNVIGFASILRDISVRKQALSALALSEVKYRSLAETVPQLVWTTDHTGKSVYLNDRWRDYLGLENGEMPPDAWTDAIHQDDAVEAEAAWHESLQSGTPYETEFRMKRKDGAYRWFLTRGLPIRDADGKITNWMGTCTDIHDHKQNLMKLSQQQRLLTEYYEREVLINRVGQAIRSSSDPEVVQLRALSVVGEALNVDRCALTLLDIPGNSAWNGRDWHREGLDPLPISFSLSDIHATEQTNARAEHTMVIPDTWNSDLPKDMAQALEDMGVRSFITVPLHDDDKLVALFCVSMAHSVRSWTSSEVLLIETVAALIRSAVESAKFNQREHRIATTLQQSLQPSIPRSLGRLTLAAYYKPALSEASIGGDFYDVYEVSPGRVALVVGDVSGKGLAAASQVSAVINMLRFALQTGKSVANAIDQVNRVLMTQDLIQGFLTLFVGIYDDKTSELTYVICGQEAPIICQSKHGTLTDLEGDGPPLGIDETAEYIEHKIKLKSGDLFLAFTDGLTESGPNRLDLLGHEGVRSLFGAACKKTDIESILTDVVIRARGRAMGFFDDDACVLAIAVN